MKRIIALFLLIVMAFTLVACGKDNDDKLNKEGTNTGNDITSSTNNDNINDDVVIKQILIAKYLR